MAAFNSRQASWPQWANRGLGYVLAHTGHYGHMRPDVSLSRREVEVLDLLVQGLTNSEIAQGLTLSHWTVKRHVARLLHKTGLRGRIDLALWYYAKSPSLRAE